MNVVIININDISIYCNLFILFGTSILLIKIHLEFLFAIKVAIIVNNSLDCYGHTDNSAYFYNTCYDMIVKKQIPKF